MNVFELAAIATTIRFIFWLLEKMIKTITVLVRKRGTMRKENGSGELFEGPPRN